MGKIVNYKSEIVTHNYVFKTSKCGDVAKTLVQSFFEITDKLGLDARKANKINTRPCHDVWSLVVKGEEWAVNKFIEEADRSQSHI